MSDLLCFAPKKVAAPSVSPAASFDFVNRGLLHLPVVDDLGGALRFHMLRLNQPLLLSLAQESARRLSIGSFAGSLRRLHQAVLVLKRVEALLLTDGGADSGHSLSCAEEDLRNFAHRCLRAAEKRRDPFAAILSKLTLCCLYARDASFDSLTLRGFAIAFSELERYLTRELLTQRRSKSVVDPRELSGGDRELARHICLAVGLSSVVPVFEILTRRPSDASLATWNSWLKQQLTPDLLQRFPDDPWLGRLHELTKLVDRDCKIPPDFFLTCLPTATAAEAQVLARVQALRTLRENAAELTQHDNYCDADRYLYASLKWLFEHVHSQPAPMRCVVREFFAAVLQRMDNFQRWGSRLNFNSPEYRRSGIEARAQATWHACMMVFGNHGCVVSEDERKALLKKHLALPDVWKLDDLPQALAGFVLG